MKKFFEKIGKTGTVIISIFTFITLIISCWQFYDSIRHENITGQWYLTFTNESSSYRPYIGETHTQKVFFTQDKCSIEGEGEKWEYNGVVLPFNMHRRLNYKGTVEGKRITARYILNGLKRESEGNIDVVINQDGKTLMGKFSGTAGDTKGSVYGKRMD